MRLPADKGLMKYLSLPKLNIYPQTPLFQSIGNEIFMLMNIFKYFYTNQLNYLRHYWTNNDFCVILNVWAARPGPFYLFYYLCFSKNLKLAFC